MKSSVSTQDDYDHQFKHVIIMQYHVIVAPLLGAVSERSSNNVLHGARRIQALFSPGVADNDQMTVLPVVPMPGKKKTPHPRIPD